MGVCGVGWRVAGGVWGWLAAGDVLRVDYGGSVVAGGVLPEVYGG
ncbi:MAG: hypothetical protein R2867_21565 [Caldilineaceae bacterium]